MILEKIKETRIDRLWKGFPMPATIWIGNIHFGNTHVPVKLHAAVRRNRVQFHLLHKKDGVKLRQRMICPLDKAPIPREEQVKGFRLDEISYVLIDPAELEQLEPESSRMIKVHEFVKTKEIDSVFFAQTYYLEPDAEHTGYLALAASLKEMDAAGICTWVMRKRAYFGTIRSTGSTLRLSVLRHADEVISAKSLALETFSPSEKELEIGSELINRMTVHFQPEKYKNEHQEKLQDLIDKKARGQKIILIKLRPRKATGPGRLLAVLQESLKKAA